MDAATPESSGPPLVPRTHDAGDGVPSRDLERRLRDSEHRFRALFEQAAVGVAMLDSATGAFLRVNRKYVEIIGYSAEQMRGLDFMSITYPEDLAEDLAAMERLRRGEIREFALEKRLLRLPRPMRLARLERAIA